MSETPRPVFTKLLLVILPYLRGRASLKDATLRVFIPAIVIDRVLSIFAQPEGHTALTFFLLGTYGLLTGAAVVLWRCSRNAQETKYFYLARIVSGLFIAVNLSLFLFVYLTNGVSL